MLGVELLAAGDLRRALQATLAAVLDITGADMGTIQLADGTGGLTGAAHSGFAPPFLDFFARVDARVRSVCGWALATRQRVVVEEVATSSVLAGSPALRVLREAGICALQSTPLLDGRGALAGMLSTHYRTPHVFEDAETRWLDLLAVRTTHLINHGRLEEELWEATRNLEHQVEERTRSLQVALAGAKAGTWRVDLLANRMLWDERSRALFETRGSGDLPFDPEFTAAHSDDRHKLKARLKEMEAVGQDAWDVEFRIVHADGTTATVRGIGRAERDPTGRLVGIAGINIDVTEQKEAEQALEQARAVQRETLDTMQRLLAASVQGILATTSAGVIESANAALESMFGYGTGELSGRHLEILVPEAFRDVHARQHATFWTSPVSRPMGQGLDLAGRRKDGSTFPIEVSLTNVPTATGGRALAFVSDITVRKRIEDELRRSHDALQVQADQLRHRTEQLRRMASDLTLAEQRAREQLAKTVHDGLQQILFSAKLRVDRLAAAPAAGADLVNLGKAQAEIEQAIAAARSLSVELFPPPLVDEKLAEAIAWLAGWMRDKYGLTVDVTADPRAVVPNKERRTLVFECVRELLFNIVKHAEVARAAVDLTLEAGGGIRIVVADEGVGFDPVEVLSKASSAHGWGLFSIRERAELIGGSMQVESSPGRGTRFTLLIPGTDAAWSAVRRRLRILIADDHVVARAGLREILAERSEFEIVGEAATGTEAVERASALRPDVIIMDVSMPEMDGVGATRQIRQAVPDILIFGLSTEERPEGLHAIEQAGAAGYFSKGDDAQKLVERLLSLQAGWLPA